MIGETSNKDTMVIEIIEEFLIKRREILERMLWVGCNPDNPELYKKQYEEGFKLMIELNNLKNEYMCKIRKIV